MAHVGKIKVPVEICSCERERWQAMNALLSEQLEEARKWHLAAVNEKRAAQADAERLFTALDGYIMARITGTDLRDYDDLAERAARAHRSLISGPAGGCECCGDEAAIAPPGECCPACQRSHEKLCVQRIVAWLRADPVETVRIQCADLIDREFDA